MLIFAGVKRQIYMWRMTNNAGLDQFLKAHSDTGQNCLFRRSVRCLGVYGND